MENKTLWKIVVTSGCDFKRDLVSGLSSESEAIDFAERCDWRLVDENGFEYGIEIEEM